MALQGMGPKVIVLVALARDSPSCTQLDKTKRLQYLYKDFLPGGEFDGHPEHPEHPEHLSSDVPKKEHPEHPCSDVPNSSSKFGTLVRIIYHDPRKPILSEKLVLMTIQIKAHIDHSPKS